VEAAVSRSVRLLALLQALRGRRRPVTAAWLAGELEVSERTIYRDMAELIAQGAPISGEAGVGYVLGPGLFLPPLMLSVDETEAVLLGLRYVDQRGDTVLKTAAEAALAKIGAVLSPDAQASLNLPTVMPGPPPAFPESVASPEELRGAIRAQTRLDIAYEDERGARTRRVIWPIQLGFLDRVRIIAAWCELRGDFRTFRLDRIRSMAALDRYPGRRAELMRRLRAHLETMAEGNRLLTGSDRMES
jgi:predicted DNA-binding transcriptional regulator YafY